MLQKLFYFLPVGIAFFVQFFKCFLVFMKCVHAASIIGRDDDKLALLGVFLRKGDALVLVLRSQT